VLVNAVPDVGPDGRIRQVVVSFMDISERAHQTQQLEKLVLTDTLTGLATRRHFIATAEREIAASRRAGGELSLLVMDVDHFKQVNDRNGHAVGDAVLVQLGATLRSVLRQADLAGRLGGEEFAVLLPHTGVKGAQEIAERLRTAVVVAPARLADGTAMPFTVSVGVATLDPSDESLAALMDRADQAMYQAKREGRNRVCVRVFAVVG
jgi:diguanylate cyclase (GGDEF)-like protein